MVSCGTGAIVVGSERPAMSVAFGDGYFSVIYSEYDPDHPDDGIPSELVCAGCLIEDGDAQLARGLDLARAHGQVDFDPELDEWFPVETV
jgi:hypothetical protein